MSETPTLLHRDVSRPTNGPLWQSPPPPPPPPPKGMHAEAAGWLHHGAAAGSAVIPPGLVASSPDGAGRPPPRQLVGLSLQDVADLVKVRALVVVGVPAALHQLLQGGRDLLIPPADIQGLTGIDGRAG